MEEHLKSTIRSVLESDNFEIVRYETGKGSEEGEGYDFIIKTHSIQVKKDGIMQDFHLVSKTMPIESEDRLLLDFKTEKYLYEKVFPVVQKKRQSLSMEPLKIPKCYYTSMDDHHMIMNNLKSIGFVGRSAIKGLLPLILVSHLFLSNFFQKLNCFRHLFFCLIFLILSSVYLFRMHFLIISDPFNLEEVKGVAASLASFHASSLFFIQNDSLDKDQLPPKGWILGKGFFDVIQILLNESTKMLEKDAISKCLLEFIENWHEVLYKIDSSTNGVQVLVHDDFWYNNLLYKGTEVAILDFQHVRLGLGMIDLVHFFCSSTTKEMRQNYAEVLKVYYDVFCSEAEQFGVDISNFSWTLLKKNFEDSLPLGYVIGILQANVCISNSNTIFVFYNKITHLAQHVIR